MSYGIRLSDIAEQDLNALPDSIRTQVERHLLSGLAHYSTLLSRRSHFPFPRQCQIFSVEIDDQTRRWEITVLFQYSQDERFIHVLGIGRAIRNLPQDTDSFGDEPDDE